jgi:hypothetical protein
VRALESSGGMQNAGGESLLDSKTESLLAESEARAEALRGENVQLQSLLAENEALMAKVSDWRVTLPLTCFCSFTAVREVAGYVRVWWCIRPGRGLLMHQKGCSQRVYAPVRVI